MKMLLYLLTSYFPLDRMMNIHDMLDQCDYDDKLYS